ncbi:DUF416 family protein [Micromonospora rosaria]|uniref:DUF416 family protein n=1 Tax=Micromonospora rosaria TaxID=47874 RepID=UPI001471BF4A|nr:DUF416 family protein [Micromonospora rosaria]
MLFFDEDRLNEELRDLGHWQRVAFVASCVEVLVPGYARFCEEEGVGDPDLIGNIVNQVWDGLRRPVLEGIEVPSPSSVLDSLPEEEDWNEWFPQAENAVAATSFLVELVRNNDASLAVRAANQCYEAVDELAARGIEGGLLDAEAREVLGELPLVQKELLRQQEAILELRKAVDRGYSTVVRLRDRASSGAISAS